MPGSNEAARASGVINTATRRAMAEERAKARGREVRRPSAVEEAAAEWEREQEARARRARDERLGISRQGEGPSFSFQQMAPLSREIPPDYDVGWKLHVPPQQEKTRRRQPRIGHVPVMSMAQRIIRRERAQARGRGWTDTDRRARALEEEARRWAAGQSLGNSRR